MGKPASRSCHAPEGDPLSAPNADLYARYVNPELAELLRVFDYGRDYVRACGTRLWDIDGKEYLDFLAGYGVHNVGHNHPRLLKTLRETLDAQGSSMLNMDAPQYRGSLARKLNSLTHPDLCRTVFANSGAEAVDVAIKTARRATGRSTIVACRGGYHGLSIGAAGLIEDPLYNSLHGTDSKDVRWVPFGDCSSLEVVCRGEKPAAFIMEPVQGEGGIRIPADSYMEQAAGICRRHGCLFVVDEIQTGLGRTGAMFATPFDRVLPDILLLGKALSGGIVPIAVAMMTAGAWKRSFGTPWACNLNASTFAGGRLAVAAAAECLAIVEDEDLPACATGRGAQMAGKLLELASRHSIIREVRQKGLLLGIEFRPASGLLMKAVPAWAREGMYAQVICALLLRDHGIVAQPCTLAPNVLRVEPPLVVSEIETDTFVAALDETLSACPDHGAALASAFRKRVLGKSL